MKVNLTDDNEVLLWLRAQGMDIRMLDSLGDDPIDPRAEVVMISMDDAAAKAKALMPRGIGAHRLSYAELGDHLKSVTKEPDATAADWQRWKANGMPPVAVRCVMVEGVVEGKRVVFEATAQFLEQARRA